MTGISLSQVVEKFWKIEKQPQVLNPNPEELECERIFKNGITRESDGRFMVRLPFIYDRPQLGESKFTAVKCFLSLERRFNANSELREKYIIFMREFIDLHHMSPNSYNPSLFEHYYIPHHGVFKADNHSKIRVVFNGSSATSIGISLNQCLHTGPKLQQDITHILLNFRRHAVVFVTDIKMMFRMTWVHPNDRRYQLILWRESPSALLVTYELATNTYGLRSSPYISIRTLLELAERERSSYPQAAAVLENDIYVDDCLTGASSLGEAQILKTELQSLMACGGYELRKWISNEPELLKDIPLEHIQSPYEFHDPDNPPTIPVLGIQYNPTADSFTCSFSFKPQKSLTKRTVLSLIARIYDPCGWISPVVFKAKAFIQRLWMSGLNWDDPLNQSLSDEWLLFVQDLENIKQLSIPRRILPADATSISLHGFFDASEAGYAAVVYLRTESSSGHCSVYLLISKSKIGPIRTRLTIPKLELQ
ncbi:uncharacterized protein LOC131847359 [Achroia grisella]|uniref:uncharacterized protein LOC131847359 n=1 Tax=Achroia grisella TaxID=688607 RepID=UPI0027D27FEB|nr:uncharacterized protein LOC131847359 [Achroia grisella]